MAPGDLIAKGSLVSVVVCLGNGDVWGLACDSCGFREASPSWRQRGDSLWVWNLLVNMMELFSVFRSLSVSHRMVWVGGRAI